MSIAQFIANTGNVGVVNPVHNPDVSIGQKAQLGSNPISATIVNGKVASVSTGNYLTDLATNAYLSMQPFVDIGNRLGSGLFWLNVGGLIGGGVLTIMSIKILMEQGK